ncbi:MAG: hypothetical protein AseanaTS_02250 [Candidatus Pelagadaptatus aseana]|uniref:DUF4381 domain-containing protein n=1 Tax=Candidatus Pelagadaptatus aseana TaxID=3120508 RepID=UPI0039B19F6B
MSESQLPSAPAFKTEDFGNPWLSNMAEVVQPAAISWWPDTPLGWLFGAVAVAVMVRQGWCGYRRWRRNAYRRMALEQIDRLQQRFQQGDSEALKCLPALLRQTLLAILPRETVVALQGDIWPQFLRHSWPDGETVASVSEFCALAYMPPEQRQSISDQQAQHHFIWCRGWLRDHQPEHLQAVAERLLA